MTHCEVFAEAQNTLESLEQTLTCNSMLTRNKLFSLPVLEAIELHYFLARKYPKALISLKILPKL